LLEVKRNAAVPACSALLGLLALLTLAPRGAAQTFTWTGAQNPNWKTNANWLGGAAPTGNGGENLVFPSGASNLSTNNNINNSTFNSITISGSGYTIGGSAITLGAGGLADSSIAGTNTVNLATTFAATRAVTVSNAGTTLTISGVISGAGGVTKAGAGTVTLSATNTYTGVTTINAGTIAVAADARLGTAPAVATAGKLTFGGGTLRTTASFTLAANRGIALTGAGTISTDPGTTLTYGGIIAGASPLTKAGTGTLIVSGANTYTGVTTIGAGTLQLGATNAVPSGSAVTVSGGAIFDLRGFSDAIGSLAGAGTVTSGAAGAVVLTAGGNNSSTTFSGVMQNGSGTVALAKTGTGTLTWSGVNTYSGTTTVSAGVLDVQNNSSLGTTAGATTVASGAALQLDGSGLVVAEPITLSGTGVAGGGALRQPANTNTWSGAITLGSAARMNADAGTLTVSGGITNGGFLLTVGGAGNTTISTTAISGTGGLTKDGTGTVTLSASNTYTGTTTVSAGTLLVNGSQGSSAVSLNGGTLGGTGTVGAITSTGSGGSVAPGVGVGILASGNVNWSSGSPGFVVQLNGTTAGTGYDQLNVTGSVNLGGATLSGTLGFSPPNGTSFTIMNNDGGDAVIGTFAGLPEGSTVVLSGQSLQISYVGGTGNDVVLSVAAPNLTVNNAVAPSASPPPGTDLTYTVTVTNNGSGNATSVVVVDTLASTLQFKVGSVVNTLPPGVSVLVAYSSDGGATWTYVPASGACSAPTNYDRCVNRIRWSLQNPLSSSAPNNTGTLKFVAQIR